MIRAISGPKFSPVSLEKQLESAVALATEKRLQMLCVRSDALSTEYARILVHIGLEKLCSNTAPKE